jgi:hypothetical protein
MSKQWSKLGGVLGIVYCIAGFFLIFLGWNGAASNDRETAQIPYLISGGIGGLGLVVLGSALIVAHSLRTDRVELRGAIDDLRAAIERGETAGPPRAVAESEAGAETETVIAGAESYHRAGCTLVVGQAEAVAMTRSDAIAAGLTACRVCKPDEVAA